MGVEMTFFMALVLGDAIITARSVNFDSSSFVIIRA